MTRWIVERADRGYGRGMVVYRPVIAAGARAVVASAQDNRRYFEGMLWVARTGSQWRYLPDPYGKWNSVFRRYRRWIESGVFDAILETLAKLAGQDRQAHMVDSTVIRAHHCAVGIKRGLKNKRGSAAHAAASRARSTPDAMARGARSASS